MVAVAVLGKVVVAASEGSRPVGTRQNVVSGRVRFGRGVDRTVDRADCQHGRRPGCNAPESGRNVRIVWSVGRWRLRASATFRVRVVAAPCASSDSVGAVVLICLLLACSDVLATLRQPSACLSARGFVLPIVLRPGSPLRANPPTSSLQSGRSGSF